MSFFCRQDTAESATHVLLPRESREPDELPVARPGDCNFEKPLAAYGYSQGRDDDLDWEQINTREKPSSDPWMPSET
ncbi:Receptor-type tyrosine-protein phosphatase mu [Liparis tanakae]|uniref:Receptor-type tyrosine-protein phosphatase mu n=1 Tax=Liparis tanakae TaxID=230148 RepID=A0A4Z2JE30_9TELE|nr:Receptor-type tyrosine-protein phosphatase mu [Liparis tanakae]